MADKGCPERLPALARTKFSKMIMSTARRAAPNVGLSHISRSSSGFRARKKKNKQNTRKETKILTRIPSIVLILHFLFLILRPNFLDFLQVPCLTLSLRGCPVLLDFTGLNTFPIGHSDLLFSALPDLPSWRHTEHTNSVQVDRVNTELNHPQLT